MTAEQLRQHMNDTFGKSTPWPQSYEVDAETYANVVQFTFDTKTIESVPYSYVKVLVGRNNGILYKGVELILRKT